MNINIEKYAQTYNSFFQNAGASDNEIKATANSAWQVSYEKADNKSEMKSFFSYNRASDITDGKDELTASFTEENQSMTEFLSMAADTLKNLVTDEDYSALAELGITADKEDMSTFVTVYERIQIELAAYGDTDGALLNINPDKIDKIIKSPSLANSMKMAEDIGNIDDGAKEYILKNELEPTVKNIYVASHAAEEAGVMPRNQTITDDEWEQLSEQVEKFFKKNGAEADEEALDAAKWLIERDIPLTMENLTGYTKLVEIENADTRDMENVKANMVLSRAFGGAYENAYMTDGWIDMEAAKEAVDVINDADEDAAYYIADNDLTLNVSNLKKYIDSVKTQAEAEPESNTKTDEAGNGEAQKKRNQILSILKDAKAVMTMAGAVAMEKLGIDVTYADIEDMVNEIKESNSTYNSVFFDEPEEEKVSQLTDVLQIMEQMSFIPVAAVGSVVQSDEDFTVNNIYNEGTRQKAAYERAGQTYEAVGTQVRRDLGDSISKAFSNVDNLIEDAGLTADDTYRRAVRVLGYNSMEVNRENIIAMAEKTTEVDNVIKNITPRTASYLIENNINPLEEDIEALNDRLLEINAQIGADENEEYSKYIWKLEKSGSLSSEERQAYIELYRAIKTIENADTRAVGAVVSEGAALTLGNLLSAEKSRTRYGTSTTVDENTGYYEGRLVKSKLADILEGIHGDEKNVTADGVLNEDIDLMWQTYASYDEQTRIKELNSSYEAYRLNEAYSESTEYTEEMVYDLLENGMLPSMENLSALSRLLKKNRDLSSFFNEEVNAEERIMGSFEDEESVSEAYSEIERTASELLNNEIETQDIESLRYRGICSAAKFMARAAENKYYNIPMNIEGETVLVKVKFSHDDGDTNNIKVSANDELTGKVEANISIKEGKLTGYIICENEGLKDAFDDGLEEWQREVYENAGNSETYTDRQLYDISKSFLKKLKDFGRMSINTNIA